MSIKLKFNGFWKVLLMLAKLRLLVLSIYMLYVIGNGCLQLSILAHIAKAETNIDWKV